MPIKILFNKEQIKDIIEQYFLEYSKLEIGHKYKVNCCVIKRVLIENNIKERTLQEQNKTQITKNKARQSSINMFGVDNPSKSEKIKAKKQATFLDKYGVKTNLQIPEIRQKAIFSQNSPQFKEKMRMKMLLNNPLNNPLTKKKMSDSLKKRYSKYSLEELREMTLKARQNITNPSKPELRIKNILIERNIQFKPHFFLNGFNYDFKIEDNTLLEIQGDYWHLNPKYYSKEDFLFNKSATEIWERDKLKRELAEKEGYKLICIWENELNSMKDNQVLNLIEN